MSSSVLSPKVLFILTNVIVIVLISESKSSGLKLASPTNNSYYEEYVWRSRACDIRSNESKNEGTKFEDILEENTEKMEIKAEKGKTKDFSEGDEFSSLPTEELNKRADNLIARVNRQRKLEARLLLGYIDR